MKVLTVEVKVLEVNVSFDLLFNAGILLGLLHFSFHHCGVAVPRRSAEDDVQAAHVGARVNKAIRAVLSRRELGQRGSGIAVNSVLCGGLNRFVKTGLFGEGQWRQLFGQSVEEQIVLFLLSAVHQLIVVHSEFIRRISGHIICREAETCHVCAGK